MRLLFVNNNPEGKGTYWRCFGLARGLVKLGHKVTIVCLQKEATLRVSRKTVAGVKIVAFPRISNSGFRELPGHLLRIIGVVVVGTLGSYDVIHTFNVASLTCGVPVFPLWLLKKLGLKRYQLVVDVDDWWGKGGLTTLNNQGRLAEVVADFLETKIPLLADRVTVVSEVLRERMIKAGVSKDRTVKIINGANAEEIVPRGRGEARGRLGLPRGGKIVCFAGTMTVNLKLVLKAFGLVLKEFSGAFLLLLNPLAEGDLELIRESGLEGKIAKVGFQPYEEYLWYLAASDILLLPRSESLLDCCEFPARLGDYLASARPVVTNRAGEAFPIIENMEVGLVAEVGDTDDFASKIINILGDEKLAYQLSGNARLAAEKYSWSKMAGVLLKEVYGE